MKRPPPPGKSDVDAAWFEYQEACDKLSEMRNPLSTHKELEIQMKLQEVEKLLQVWMDRADFFKTSLN